MTFDEWKTHQQHAEKLDHVRTRLPSLKREVARLEHEAEELEQAGIVGTGIGAAIRESKNKLESAEGKVVK